MTTTSASAGSGSADRPDDAPFFPAPRLPQLSDAATAAVLVGPVIRSLAEIVDVAGPDLARPTPCTRYTVGELRDHVLGWLQFFAAAFADPAATTVRPDPQAYRADQPTRGAGTDPAAPAYRDVVLNCATTLDRALAGGVLEQRVRMSQSWMDAPAALGMVLGEYLVHGWDLARAQDLPWRPSDRACAVAREFLEGMVRPEYRGGDGGFFDQEVPVAAGASELDRLIGFAGRDPGWTVRSH
jgi:uncharacterized protein (TIGR03086 family)